MYNKILRRSVAYVSRSLKYTSKNVQIEKERPRLGQKKLFYAPIIYFNVTQPRLNNRVFLHDTDKYSNAKICKYNYSEKNCFASKIFWSGMLKSNKQY